MSTEFVQISVDASQFEKFMGTAIQEQFPYAYAKSLTEVAELARRGVGVRTQRAFKLHGAFIPRNIRKQAAMKSDFKLYGYAESAVYTGEKLDGWMGQHEEGATRRPHAASGAKDRGKALALPGEDLKSKSFKTSTGKIRKRYKPAELLKNYDSSRQSPRSKSKKVGRGGAKGRVFIIRGKNSGTAMVVRRTSKRRYPIEILYVFAKEVQINKSWGFERTVQAVAQGTFSSVFAKEIQSAITTARR